MPPIPPEAAARVMNEFLDPAPHPAGDGSAAIFRSMAADGRWLEGGARRRLLNLRGAQSRCPTRQTLGR
jgi:hypothetical protein